MRGVPRQRVAISIAPGSSISTPKNLRRALQDDLQVVVSVELQPQHDAEARAQRRRQQPRARGGADKRERPHLDGVGARRRPLPDDDVELVVLQRRVEQLFQRGLQAVHFVDEQHLLVAQVGQDGGQVALDLQRRPRGLLERRAHFVGDDVGQRGLAQPRRPVEQHVVQRLAARLGGLDGDFEVVFDLVLPDELAQPLRTQLQLEGRIVLQRHRRNDALASGWRLSVGKGTQGDSKANTGGRKRVPNA